MLLNTNTPHEHFGRKIDWKQHSLDIPQQESKTNEGTDVNFINLFVVLFLLQCIHLFEMLSTFPLIGNVISRTTHDCCKC